MMTYIYMYVISFSCALDSILDLKNFPFAKCKIQKIRSKIAERCIKSIIHLAIFAQIANCVNSASSCEMLMLSHFASRVVQCIFIFMQPRTQTTFLNIVAHICACIDSMASNRTEMPRAQSPEQSKLSRSSAAIGRHTRDTAAASNTKRKRAQAATQ